MPLRDTSCVAVRSGSRCLLVMTRGEAHRRRSIFMTEAKWCGHDSRGNPVPHDDLPVIAERFDAFRRRKTARPSPAGTGSARRH